MLSCCPQRRRLGLDVPKSSHRRRLSVSTWCCFRVLRCSNASSRSGQQAVFKSPTLLLPLPDPFLPMSLATSGSSSNSNPMQDNEDIFARRDLRDPRFSTWKAPKELKGGHHRAVRCLAWSCDGRKLASGGSDKAVRIWQPERASLDRSSQELRGHTDTVEALVWDPTNPERVATAALDRTVR